MLPSEDSSPVLEENQHTMSAGPPPSDKSWKMMSGTKTGMESSLPEGAHYDQSQIRSSWRRPSEKSTGDKAGVETQAAGRLKENADPKQSEQTSPENAYDQRQPASPHVYAAQYLYLSRMMDDAPGVSSYHRARSVFLPPAILTPATADEQRRRKRPRGRAKPTREKATGTCPEPTPDVGITPIQLHGVAWPRSTPLKKTDALLRPQPAPSLAAPTWLRTAPTQSPIARRTLFQADFKRSRPQGSVRRRADRSVGAVALVCSAGAVLGLLFLFSAFPFSTTDNIDSGVNRSGPGLPGGVDVCSCVPAPADPAPPRAAGAQQRTSASPGPGLAQEQSSTPHPNPMLAAVSANGVKFVLTAASYAASAMIGAHLQRAFFSMAARTPLYAAVASVGTRRAPATMIGRVVAPIRGATGVMRRTVPAVASGIGRAATFIGRGAATIGHGAAVQVSRSLTVISRALTARTRQLWAQLPPPLVAVRWLAAGFCAPKVLSPRAQRPKVLPLPEMMPPPQVVPANGARNPVGGRLVWSWVGAIVLGFLSI